jgi:hypothetical protein
LRHLLAAAVACQAPVLSAEAQEFLGKPNRGAEQWVMSALHACTALHAGVWCLCLSQQLAFVLKCSADCFYRSSCVRLLHADAGVWLGSA